MLSEPQTADLEERISFLSRVGRTAKETLEWYFEPKAFEREDDGRIYHYLGVHYFKKIVPTDGTYINRLRGISYKEKMKDKAYLEKFEKESRHIEALHDLTFLVMILGLYVTPDTTIAISFTIANLAVNVYPSLLQRYNRARIYNALDKLDVNERKE